MQARAKAGLLPKATSATGRALGRRPTVPYEDRPIPLTLVALALLPGCVIVQSLGRMLRVVGPQRAAHRDTTRAGGSRTAFSSVDEGRAGKPRSTNGTTSNWGPW